MVNCFYHMFVSFPTKECVRIGSRIGRNLGRRSDKLGKNRGNYGQMNVISLIEFVTSFYTVSNDFSWLITTLDNTTHTCHSWPNIAGLGFLSRFLTGPTSIESFSLVPTITTALSLTLPPPTVHTCPQAGASRKRCFNAIKSSQVAKDAGDDDHRIKA
jgi:hypothetical protein